MQKVIGGFFLTTFLLLTFSCGGGGGITDPTLGIGGGGGSGGSSSGGDNPNVTGKWNGTYSSIRDRSGSFSLTLEQNGSSFTGSGSVSGSDCFFIISVSGSVSGNEITFGFVEDYSGDRVNFSGSASSSSMSGEYWVDSAGFCAGDSGTFSADKTS